VGLHRTDLSDAEAAEAMRPLDDEALAAWYGSSLPRLPSPRRQETLDAARLLHRGTRCRHEAAADHA